MLRSHHLRLYSNAHIQQNNSWRWIIYSKHVEDDYWNKLREKSASCWSLIRKYITISTVHRTSNALPTFKCICSWTYCALNIIASSKKPNNIWQVLDWNANVPTVWKEPDGEMKNRKRLAETCRSSHMIWSVFCDLFCPFLVFKNVCLFSWSYNPLWL
jgi:hypothetical protein